MKNKLAVSFGVVSGVLFMSMPSVAEQAAPMVAKVNAEQQVYRLDLNFATGKAAIPTSQDAAFKKLADDLKNYPYAKIMIEGHTDTVGTGPDNLKLSQQRADAVRAYLMKHYGVAAGRITAQGFGFTKPVATNDTEEGRALNRRIEAIVIRMDNSSNTGQPKHL